MANQAPAFQHYAKDFLADCAFLSMEDRGILITLRSLFWSTGALPNDLELLAQICLANADAFALRWHSKIHVFFDADGENLIAKDLQAQKAFQSEKREKAQTSAQKRWGKEKDVPTDMRTHKPTDMPSECTATATAFKRTTNVVPKKTASRIPEGFSVDADMRIWASKNTPGVRVEFELEKFIDYYKAASGKNAVGLDWTAKWRTWMRNQYTKFDTITPKPKEIVNTSIYGVDYEAEYRKEIVADVRRREHLAKTGELVN